MDNGWMDSWCRIKIEKNILNPSNDNNNDNDDKITDEDRR